MTIWIIINILTIMKNAAIHICIYVFVWKYVTSFFENTPISGLSGVNNNCIFNDSKNVFQKCLYSFLFPQRIYEFAISLHFANTYYWLAITVAIPVGMRWYFFIISILYFSGGWWCWASSMVLSSIWIIFPEEISIQILCSLFNRNVNLVLNLIGSIIEDWALNLNPFMDEIWHFHWDRLEWMLHRTPKGYVRSPLYLWAYSPQTPSFLSLLICILFFRKAVKDLAF